jgi:asparagine synthase (glutamine-hydrolysing)
MCGIAGILNLTADHPVEPDDLIRMVEALRHRGPDESGIYIDDQIGLGHARLSIIDLSSGTQPIHNEDQSHWIVYNGEIFNYPELKDELLSKGHRFYTNTDTEVILHLFEEKGISCLEDLNGQFAFAIWNAKEKELFLARDRTGIVPLVYTIQKGRLIFASEIKGIFSLPGIKRELDPMGLDQVFTFWSTIPGRTAFQDIHEVPAGHYLWTKEKRWQLGKYWDFSFSENRGLPSPSRIDDIVEETKTLLKDAVRIRLRADVPVGSYLSGGIDSSGLTAVIRRNFNNRLRTFGITFEEGDFDEREHQESMVKFLNVDHSSVEATNKDICQSFQDTIWHCEAPLLRTGPVPLFLLSGLVRESGYKVVVTGEGADEVFGGYNIFREAKVRAFWSRQPDSEMRPMLIGKLYPYIFKDERSRKNLRNFFGTHLDKINDPFFSHLIRWYNTAKAKTFFSADFNEQVENYNCFEDLQSMLPDSFSNWDPVTRAQYLEMKVFLTYYLLSSQGDRVAMGHSIEVRPPYLDHRIIEMMAEIPAALKIRGMNEKYLLKRCLDGVLPQKILMRAKQPYRAPVSNALLGEDGKLVKEYLNSAVLDQTGLFDSKKVGFLLNKVERSKKVSEIDNMSLAGILSTQIIHDQFIDASKGTLTEPAPPDMFIDRRASV